MSLSKRFLVGTDGDIDRLAFSVPEAAARLGIGKTTIYKMIAGGTLRAVKIGKRTLIPANDLHMVLIRQVGPIHSATPSDQTLR